MGDRELSRRDREMAADELRRIEQTLSQMSRWADGDTADRERASIMLEDAARNVMAAGWLIGLIGRDPARVADLVHRRMSGDGYSG